MRNRIYIKQQLNERFKAIMIDNRIDLGFFFFSGLRIKQIIEANLKGKKIIINLRRQERKKMLSSFNTCSQFDKKKKVECRTSFATEERRIERKRKKKESNSQQAARISCSY